VKKKATEIGAATAVIHRITTTVDGGILITLAISSEDHKLASSLMAIRSSPDPVVTVAFVRTESSHAQMPEFVEMD